MNSVNLKLEIVNDQYPENPREFYGNLAIMACFHKRYNLGDETSFVTSDFSSWDEMEEHLIEKEKVVCLKPLYLYDHDGITITTTPFRCRWDSGQLGFVYTTKAKIREKFMIKRVTKRMLALAERHIDAEVEGYDAYLRGDVYGWEITDLETEEVIDSCYGYYDEAHCRRDGEEALRCHI